MTEGEGAAGRAAERNHKALKGCRSCCLHHRLHGEACPQATGDVCLPESQPDSVSLGETTNLSIHADLGKAKGRLTALDQSSQDQEKAGELKNSDTRGKRKCGAGMPIDKVREKPPQNP